MPNESVSTPLVSILIPVYNHEKYIVECLDSIAKQEYTNIEVLLLDDGSKDNSYEVALSWVKQHPAIRATISKQDNQGVCKTLNTLVQKAKGEYIALCASDDGLTPSSIANRLASLEKNPSKMAVIGDARLIDQNSEEISGSALIYLYKASYPKLLNDVSNILIFRWTVVGPTLLIRRTAYEELGLYDEQLVVEDREFYLRLLAEDKLYFLPEQVANYRIHDDNASRKNNMAKLIVYEQMAISNLKHSSKFEGLKYIFLKSYVIDLLILKLGRNKLSFCLLTCYRALRYVLFYR